MGLIRGKLLKLLMKNTHCPMPPGRMAIELGVPCEEIIEGIEELTRMGCVIERETDGYRLTALSDALYPEVVEACCPDDENAPYTVLHYDEVESTNDTAVHLAKAGAPHGSVVVAEDQRSGRGRQGRSWHSEKGEGVFCSILLRPKIAPGSASLLSLMAGVAVARAIARLGLNHVGLKWPNDVLCRSRKVCGILSEMALNDDQLDYVVLGMGINVNQSAFPGELSGIATSLRMETGCTFSRPRVLAAVLTEFFHLYDEMMASGSFGAMLGEYEDWSICLGRELTARQGKEEITGLCTGIDEDGALLLVLRDGTVRRLLAGDISIRGDEIYV